jgi:hypothetical protein
VDNALVGSGVFRAGGEVEKEEFCPALVTCAIEYREKRANPISSTFGRVPVVVALVFLTELM